MKRLLIILLAVAMLPQTIEAKKKTSDKEYDLKVMSYNIRLGIGKDGTNSWEFRYPATALMIEDQQPDVFGVQEAHDFQILFIKENLRNYDCVGVGREDGKSEGEHMSIFWNKKKISLIKSGTFWLSETPEKPSKGWDAHCKRTATWALMKENTADYLWKVVEFCMDRGLVEKEETYGSLSVSPEGWDFLKNGGKGNG